MKFNRRRQTKIVSTSNILQNTDCRWKFRNRALRIAAEIAFRGSAASLAFLALFGFNPQALAATDTWTGADTAGTPTSDWINADNWAAGIQPVSGDSLVFGSTNLQTSGTLTDSLTTSSFAINGITFSYLAPAYTFTGNAFGLAGSIVDNSVNTQTINNAITLDGTETFQTNPFGGNISLQGGIGDSGSNFGITVQGGGTVIVGGATASTYTGATTINSGALQINFTNASAPASNLISPSSALLMNGGRLRIVGAATGSTQTFARTAIQAGGNVISTGTAAATGVLPTVNLGTLTGNTSGLVEFIGPAYNSGASSGTTAGGNTIAATGSFTATSQTGIGGVIESNTGAADSVAYATVGLYDWAAISTGSAGAGQVGTIVGASQIPGFYTVEGALAANTFGLNVDLTANATMSGNSSSLGSEYSTIRFNTLGAITLTTGRATSDNSMGAVLVTPNVGANNTTIAGTVAFQPSRDTAGGATSFTVWQNNTAGELIISAPYTNAKSGASAYTQGGAGTVFLSSAASSYTGVNNLDGGTTVIQADIGLGAVATGAGVNLGGGTLLGNATFTLDNGGANARPVTLLGGGGGIAATAGNTLTIDGLIGSAATGSGPLTIGIPASSANNQVVGLVAGTGTNTANATALMASGVVNITGANFYFGGTTLASGTLRINGINALGGADYGGITFNGGTLQYAANFSGNGSGDLTSIGTAGVTLAGGGGTIDLNGNAVTYANSVGNGGTGSLVVMSSLAGGSLTMAGNNTFSGSITLNSGNLTLGGINTNTGTTAVNGGNLTLTSGASMGNTSVVVSNGHTLTATPGSGNIQIGATGGALTLNAGTTLTMADGSTGTLTFNQTGSGAGTVLSLLGTSANPDFLTLNVGGTGNGADELIANNGTAVLSGSGGTLITLSAFGSSAPTSLTNIPLLSVPNGSLVLQDFALQSNLITSWSGGVYNAALSLNGAGNALLLTLTQQVSNLNYYWTGATDNTWTTVGNFATDASGTQAQTNALTNSDNVFETATTSQNNTQLLNGNYALNALAFTGTNAVTLQSGTISLNALNTFKDTSTGNQYAGGIGLVVEPNVPADTIAAAVNLQRNQTWEIDNAASAPLTVSGVIGNGLGSDSLTKTGVGTLILAGSNTYTGGTIINGGTIALGIGNALLSTSSLTVSGSGATFDLAGFNQALGGLSDGGTINGTITASTGNSVLTITGSTASTFNGFITDNAAGTGASLGLAYAGSSTLTMGGSNHYTGATTVSNGTLVAASNFALGNPLSTSGGLVMNPVTGGTATVDFTSANPTIASLASSGGGTSLLVLGNVIGTASPTSLTIGLANNSTVFNGTITDDRSILGAATGAIVLAGGSLTLGGSDSYFGSTTLAAGNLILANSFALQDSTLITNAGGGTLSFGSLTAATFGSLSGNGSIPLLNATSGAVALTVGVNGATNSYSGSLSGAGSLIISTGNLTLTGANSYTGATTLNAGTTTFSTGGSLGLSNTAGAITQNGGTLNIAGGFINTASFTNNNGAIINVSANGTLDVVGTLTTNASNGNNSGLLAVTSGTVNANAVLDGRGGAILTGIQNTGSTTNDIYVNGGALNIATTFDIGTSSNRDTSSSSVRIDSGVINVGGITNITNDAGGRYSLLDVNGGVFNENDSSGTGILLGGNANTGLNAELLVSGSGVLNTPGIVLGNSADNGGTFVFQDIGGTTNLGAGGISSAVPTAAGAILDVNLGLATSTAAPILTATASWSSALAMNLNNNSTGIAPAFNTLPGTTIALTGNLTTTGTGGIIVSGSGTVALSGNNTYNGVTTITGGTLSLQSAGASGSTSAVTFAGRGGTLQYSANNTTDFSPIFANSTAPISIDTNGQAITFGTAFAGTNTGGLSVGDSSGSGTLTLTAANTYTGATTINNNGKLILGSGASLGDTPITVNQGGLLQALAGTGNLQIGASAASLTLAAGGAFSMADNSVGTVTLNQVGAGTNSLLNLNGTTTNPDSLTFDIGAAGADQLIVNNGIVTFAASNANTNIFIDSILGAAPASLTNIPILDIPNGALVLGDFTLETPNLSLGGSSFSASLTVGGVNNSELFLNLTQGATTNAYFTGLHGTSWSNIANFSPTAAGTVAQSGSLNSVTNVFLNANNATGVTSETLDGNFAINSLSFTSSATQSITLASGTGTALTLLATNGFTDAASNAYAAGTGLVVQPGSASHTISANINLGASQTWNVNNAPGKALIITGVIADAPSTTLDSLTKTGTGTLILENAETYDGGTTVNQGTLMLGAGGSLISTGTLTVSGTGTFDLGANSQTVARVSSGGATTGFITATGGADTLTVINSAADTIRQTLTDASATNSAASLALLLAGTSTVTLSNSNNFTGGVTLASGGLTVSNDYGLGSATTSNLNAGLNFTNTGASTVSFTSAAPHVASIAGNNLGSGASDSIVLGTTAGSGSSTTLFIGAGGEALFGAAGTTYNGTISDLASQNPAAVGNLVIYGGGLVNLGGVDTFTGTTVISGSGTPDGGVTFFPSTLQLQNSFALEDSTLNYNNQGGVLSFGSLSVATLAGLTGSQNLALSDPGSGSVVLTVGNNNVSSLYTGNLSGPGGLTKSGTGTFQVGSGANGGASFSGSLLVNSGTLTLGGAGTITGAVNIGSANGQSGIIFQDSASVNSASQLGFDVGSNTSPSAATLTMNSSGTVAVAGITFGNGTDRAAVGDFLTINSGSVLDSGSLNFMNTVGGTTNEGFVTINLNGGLLGVNNFVASNFGGNAASAAVFNFNGGTLEALASDPNGSTFLPAITRLTVNVGVAGAIINTNGFTDTITQALITGTAGDGGLTKLGSGILTLAGSNTYIGATRINGGELTLGNSNALSSSSALTFTGSGALRYTPANTTDYSSRFANSTSPVAIDVNGQAISFATPIAATNSGGLSVQNSVANTGGLTLTTAQSYTGQTLINSGASLTLASGASLPNPNVAINGTLVAQTGNAGINAGTGTVVLNGGGALSLMDGQIGSLTINGGITIGSATAGALDFDINTSTGATDLLTLTGGVTYGSGGGVINFTDLSTTSTPSTLRYTLIGAASGLNSNKLTLGQTSILINGQTFSLSLANSTATSEILTLTQIVSNYYWTGVNSASWGNIGNFAESPAGSPPWTGSLGASSNVFETANSASTNRLTQSLDGNFTVNSLSFTGTGTTAGTSSITINNGSSTNGLTIAASAAFGDQNNTSYSPGTGLVVQPGSASHTIAANINLGNSQTWIVNNSPSNPLIVSGVIADGSTADALTKTGTGTLIINTAETYDGGTIINQGTLQIGVNNGLLANGNLTVSGSGVFNLNGKIQSLGGLSDGGSSTGIITSSTGAATLTLNNTGNISYGGAINDNNAVNGATLALNIIGTGNVTLSGSSNFSGGTALNSTGILTVANNYALGNPNATAANTGLTINAASGGTNSVFFTSSSPTIAALNYAGTGLGGVVLGGTAAGGTATTLSIGAGNLGISNFAGTISDLSGTAAGAVGSVNIINGGVVTFTGTNTYTGTTMITGTASQLVLGNSLAIENSIYDPDGGGVLNTGTFTSITLGGLTGNTGFPLVAGTTGSALALTVGNGNVSSSYNGNLSGAGVVTKTGTGNITLNNATYTGNTVIQNGSVTFSGSTSLTTHLDIAAQQGVASAIITGSGVVLTSTGAVYISSPTGGTGTIFGQHANLTVSGGAKLIALPDATGRAISYGNATDRPAGTGIFTIGTAGDTTTLVDAQGSLDLFHGAGGGTVGNLTVNLNGGTLEVNNILKTIGGTTQTSTFNFNGGVLQALASDPAGSQFLPQFTGLTANVQTGGAVINTNSFNITIAQPLVSGTSTDGGLTKNGLGNLTLAGTNTYVGATNVNAGRLIVSGSTGTGLISTSAVNIASGGTLEDDSVVNNAITTVVSGRLSGNGSIGAVSILTSGTLAPGFNSTTTAAGTLSTHGNVTFATLGKFNIRLGVATPTDSDQLFMSGGSISLRNTTLTLTDSANFNPAVGGVGFVYILINGGAGSTGTGVDVFGNATTSGSTYTDADGDVFGIFYAVNGTNTGAGSDVVAQLEVVAVPEPGTWASLLGGMGVMLVWNRRRRRAS